MRKSEVSRRRRSECAMARQCNHSLGLAEWPTSKAREGHGGWGCIEKSFSYKVLGYWTQKKESIPGRETVYSVQGKRILAPADSCPRRPVKVRGAWGRSMIKTYPRLQQGVSKMHHPVGRYYVHSPAWSGLQEPAESFPRLFCICKLALKPGLQANRRNRGYKLIRTVRVDVVIPQL